MDPQRREKLSLIGMYIAYYAPSGFLTPFLSVYLKNQAGFDDVSVGTILALGLMAAVIGQYALGWLTDRAVSKNRILGAVYLACAVSAAVIPINKSFIYTAAMVCTLYFFLFPIQPLTDTIALEICAPRDWNIGKLRVAAVTAYAVTSYAAGSIVGLSSPSIVFFIFAGLTLFGGIPVLSAPGIPGHQSGLLKKIAPAALFKNRDLTLLLAAGFLVFITGGYYYSFFSVYFISPSIGGNMSELGSVYALAALSEIPMFFTVNRVLRNIPIEKALTASMIFLGVRWLLFGWFTSPAALMIVNMLNGVSMSPFLIFSAYYIDRHVGPELKASGQTLFCIVTNGFGRLIGTFGGGILVQHITYAQAFLVSSVLCFFACALFCLVSRRQRQMIAECACK